MLTREKGSKYFVLRKAPNILFKLVGARLDILIDSEVFKQFIFQTLVSKDQLIIKQN